MDTFVEAAVQRVLTAAEAGVDAEIADAALLLACAGAGAECDRLVARWRAVTDRPVTGLAPDAVTARAWAMLFAARGGRPDWAAELTPLDLDAEEHAHHELLTRHRDTSGTGHRQEQADPQGPDEPRHLAALAQERAARGDHDGAVAALDRWAELARTTPRPDLAALAACRQVAPLLVAGTLPLPEGWAPDYAGALIAALHARYAPTVSDLTWERLVRRVLELRGTSETAPAPATAAALAEAGRRLGVRLPDGYRDFLTTCDGLPADVVFPRLLGTAELYLAAGDTDRTDDADRAEIVITDPATVRLRPDGTVIEQDPLFGRTHYADVRALLERHRELLEAAR